MLDAGDFFQHFWVHQTFQMVERDIPPDIGRRMGGVSLLFAPLKLCSPSATISPCSTIVALFCIGIFFPLSLGSQPKLTFCSSLYWSCPVSLLCIVLCRVLRDSTPRFVGLSIRPSVRRSVTLYFFDVNGVFGLTAPAQMLHWPQLWPLPTRTRLG